MTIDPISDMLVTIRNGLKARLVQVSTPASNIKSEIAKVMKASGYIQDAFTTSDFPKKLVITLKYSDRAEPAIRGLARQSKPGLRKFVGCAEIPSVQNEIRGIRREHDAEHLYGVGRLLLGFFL